MYLGKEIRGTCNMLYKSCICNDNDAKKDTMYMYHKMKKSLRVRVLFTFEEQIWFILWSSVITEQTLEWVRFG